MADSSYDVRHHSVGRMLVVLELTYLHDRAAW